MGYKFEDKLRGKAEEFIGLLKNAGITASVVEGSLRDYTVKILILVGGKEAGKVNLYYSPRSDSFSLATHEVKDKPAARLVEDCWRGTDSPGRKPSRGYEIYVDGSFINGLTGYGVVVLKDGDVVDELSGAVSDPSVAYARQVAGELFAVEEALRWCKEHSINEVSIFYDYYGIEKWATGRWKAKQPLTVKYREFVRDSGVRIHWHKVNSHTGDRWNDRADALAKKGAGASRAPAASAADDERLNELMKKADAFIEFLMVKGIEAAFEKIYNDQFARLLIIEDDKRVGVLDLYHTKKKPLSPYLHDFKDEQMKSRIQSYWEEFKQALV